MKVNDRTAPGERCDHRAPHPMTVNDIGPICAVEAPDMPDRRQDLGQRFHRERYADVRHVDRQFDATLVNSACHPDLPPSMHEPLHLAQNHASHSGSERVGNDEQSRCLDVFDHEG
jgi:hypothetical protein